MTEAAGDSATVMIVCTGNLCRSPLMERLLVARLKGGPELQLPESRVRVISAGTEALAGRPMTDRAAEELIRLGGDPDGFVSQQLTGAMVASADLVVTATRAHRAAVVTLMPRATRYTFTAIELARLLRHTAASSLPADARSRVRALAAAAASSRGLTAPVPAAADDIPDPFGRSATTYRQASDLMDPAIMTLAAAVRA